MRNFFFTLLAFFFIQLYSLHSLAQDVHWNNAPQKGFVFQISNNEAQKLLTGSTPDTIFKGLLHTQIDTFNVSKGWVNRPSKGHFILAKIVGNKLQCDYTCVFPYQVFLLKEYDALSLQVVDIQGNVRTDAKVKFKFRRLRIDTESKTYRIENDYFYGENKTVTVELDGFRSVFDIEKHGIPTWSDYGNHNDGPDFYSYMVTDKNKYKPNERVRFKSYALSQLKWPLRSKLELWLDGNRKQLKLEEVTPHRPGSYSSEFKLNDSLKLVVGKDYYIQLREHGGRTVASCKFRFEDYELFGNKLDVQLASNQQFYPDKNELTITATDVNNLLLKDAKATVLIKIHSVYSTYEPITILPDTLLFSQIDLNADGPTKINIPSALFQNSNTSYDVIVKVLNSENQLLERDVHATFFYSQYELATHFSNDSICYDLLYNNVPMEDVATQLRHSGELKPIEVHLPYKEKINPAFTAVFLENNFLTRQISMGHLIPGLMVVGGLQKDSFNIAMQNPQKLDISWYIYQGSTLLQKGFGKTMDFKSLVVDRTQTYYVELLYSFGGEDHVKRSSYNFKEDFLDISLNIPERIYPGQKVDASITVRNQTGEPMRGVDLTAFAVTSKLDYYFPTIPYWGTSSSPRSKKANYSKTDHNKRSATLDLDYYRWEKPARLDTMKYFQFTYPARGYFRHVQTIIDSTQFSPFVMFHGQAMQVYIVEVDHVPVYYSWVNQPKDYSFYIAPNQNHQISLRLFDKVLVWDSIRFQSGVKTILSLDLDHLPKGLSIVKLANAFSQTEINRLHAYIASFESEQKMCWLESAKNFTPLSAEQANGYFYKKTVVAGPIIPGKMTFIEIGGVRTSYKHTGGYHYLFDENIVYKKDAGSLFPVRLYNNLYNPMLAVNDLVMTKAKFLASKAVKPFVWKDRSIDVSNTDLKLRVLLPYELEASGVAGVFFENCKTKKTSVLCLSELNGYRNDFYKSPKGCNHVCVVYNNGTYLKMDSIPLIKHSHVILDLGKSLLHPADSLSKDWLSERGVGRSRNCFIADLGKLKEDVTHYFTQSSYGNVHGKILDETNTPLPGATVMVEGTSIGTISDDEGNFILSLPDQKTTLVISFIGYNTEKIEVPAGSMVSVTMVADIMSLDEVVVIGYGTTRKSDVTGSISEVNSSELRRAPDDKVEEGKRISDDKIIQNAELRLYQELLTLNSIRSNFSDVGFWEPRLFTDKHGESKFKITFPDDITQWNAVVYGMNSNAQTGMIQKSIKSYKPLMAELHVPQFLTRGDSAFFLGKVLNYTSDSIIVGNVKWSDVHAGFEKNIQFKSFYMDKLPVIAGSVDSIKSSYRFTRNDGYLDGEERTVPVVAQGVVRANGTLSVLKMNDFRDVKALDNQQITVKVMDSQIAVYDDEINNLLDYKYACNEQLASKLIGLVNHKLLMKFKNKQFKYDRDIQKIITRLLKNQNQEFLWSWWDVSKNTSSWMSAHILRALNCAKDAGYKVDLNMDNLFRKATYRFEFLKEIEVSDVDLLNALAGIGVILNYGQIIHGMDSLILANERKQSSPNYEYIYRNSYLKEKFLLQEIRQMKGIHYQRDSLLKYKKENILGEVYFEDNEKSFYWYNDNLAANIIAYRLIHNDSVLENLRLPMQMHFIASRSKYGWNTYRSSNIIMSVLPDLLKDGFADAGVITVTGKENSKITSFPYQVTLKPTEELHILKNSGLPVYYMQYIQERVTEAKTGVEGFEIQTNFEDNKLALEAGQPVRLEVHVRVSKDADIEHVMIEVPIPGACSYADKHLQDNRVETHREYFKERTVIFCENMDKGEYTFYVHLLPRYTGKYMLNPSQVSLMYIPVVNANTALKTVEVNAVKK